MEMMVFLYISAVASDNLTHFHCSSGNVVVGIYGSGGIFTHFCGNWWYAYRFLL